MRSSWRSFWQHFRAGRRGGPAPARGTAREIRDGMGPAPSGTGGRINPPAVYRYFERKIRSSD